MFEYYTVLITQTIYAICSISLPFESPYPGVSIKNNYSFDLSPNNCVNSPFVSVVFGNKLSEDLKMSLDFIPVSDLQVALLPLPVAPIMH